MNSELNKSGDVLDVIIHTYIIISTHTYKIPKNCLLNLSLKLKYVKHNYNTSSRNNFTIFRNTVCGNRIRQIAVLLLKSFGIIFLPGVVS